MWIQRTIDSYSLLRPSVLLNIIEGVYAQNGDGFTTGPGAGGVPEIFMTNVLIFGKDAFRVDIVGALAGRARTRQFRPVPHRQGTRAFPRRSIRTTFRFIAGKMPGPNSRALQQFNRTPLTSPYLPRDEEARFHLCNEAVYLPGGTQAACLSGRPAARHPCAGAFALRRRHVVHAGIQRAARHARTAGRLQRLRRSSGRAGGGTCPAGHPRRGLGNRPAALRRLHLPAVGGRRSKHGACLSPCSGISRYPWIAPTSSLTLSPGRWELWWGQKSLSTCVFINIVG